MLLFSIFSAIRVFVAFYALFVTDQICRNLRHFLGKIILAQTLFV